MSDANNDTEEIILELIEMLSRDAREARMQLAELRGRIHVLETHLGHYRAVVDRHEISNLFPINDS